MCGRCWLLHAMVNSLKASVLATMFAIWTDKRNRRVTQTQLGTPHLSLLAKTEEAMLVATSASSSARLLIILGVLDR